MNASTQRNDATASRGDSPESTSTEKKSPKGWTVWARRGTNVSELVLCARCDMAMAIVVGPLDMRRGYAYARSAKRWAYRAGIASLNGTGAPIGFVDSPTLMSGWLAGQHARAKPASRTAFAVL